MRSLLEKLYFFYILCEVATVIPSVFGGGTASAGGQASLLHSADSNVTLLLFNVAVVALTLFLSFSRLLRIWQMLLQVKWLFALYLLAVVSIFWSTDYVATFRVLIYALVYLVSAAYISLRFEPEELIELVAGSSVVLAGLSIAGQFVLPPTGDLAPGWTGVFLQKNQLGIAMAIGIIALTMLERRWNLYRLGGFALCVALLLLSQSFTAVLCVFAAFATLAYLRLDTKGRRLLLTSVIGGAAILFAFLPNALNLLLGLDNKSTSLTGRNVIWAFAFNSIAEKPIVGHGYEGFWAGAEDAALQSLGWNPHQAHNGYLQIALDLGVLGLLLTVAFLVNSLRRAVRVRTIYQHPIGRWLLIITLVVIVHNVAESDLMTISELWYILMASYLMCWRAEQEQIEALAGDDESEGAIESPSGELLVS